jgi:hypothetical protein
MTTLDKIIKFEDGELDNLETVELFSDLIKSGQAWALQGSYGRLASDLIQRNLIKKDGEINWPQFNFHYGRE